MLSVIWSDSLRELADRLVADVRVRRESDPLAQIDIAIPDATMGRWLRYRLAEQLGVVANIRMGRLHGLVARQIVATHPKARILNSEAVRSLVLDQILNHLDDSELAQVRRYVGEGSGSFQKAFGLAGKVATLFEAYASERPDLVAAWATNTATEDDTERWQRHLYRKCIIERGAPTGDADPMWLLPDGLDRADDMVGLPDPIYLFGFGAISVAMARVVCALAQRTSLRVFSYAPDQTVALAHPIARSWGRAGHVSLTALGKAAKQDHVVSKRSPTTLLGHVQRDIAEGRTPSPTQPDDTLRVLACPTRSREMEIVANEIWNLVLADETLGFRDIAVAVAGSEYPSYAALATSAFDRLHRIPLDRVGVRSSSASGIVDAARALLRLPGSELRRNDVLQAVNPLTSGVDIAAWRVWADELGVVLGADSGDYEDTYVDGEVFHWDQALRRMALGAFMTGPQTGDDRPFRRDDGHAWTPHEAASDTLASAGRLMKRMRALIDDGRRIVSAEMSLEDWSDLLAQFFLRYLGANRNWGDRDAVQRAQDQCIEALSSLRGLDVDGRPVPYAVARAFADNALEGAGTEAEGLVSRGVVLGPLPSLRALPFRVIFVIGLNANDFPRRAPDEQIDLRRRNPQPDDVGVAEADKQLLLETLMTARDRLYLSYVARDAVTGEPNEPSLMVRELERALGSYVDRPADLVRRYPVSASSDAGADTAPVHDASARRSAAIRTARRQLWGTRPPPSTDDLLAAVEGEAQVDLRERLRLSPPPPPRGSHGHRDEIRLPLTAVRRFLECPLQGSARAVLGLWKEDDEDDWLSRVEEPLDASFLLRAVLLREAFWTAPTDRVGSKLAYEAAFDRHQLRGELPVGFFGDRLAAAHGEILDVWCTHATRPDLAQLDAWASVRFGQAHEFENVEQILPPIVIDVQLPAGPARVALHGGTTRLAPDRTGAMLCVARKQDKPSDTLRLALEQVALAASGAALPDKTTLYINATDPDRGFRPRPFASPSQDDARAWLGTIVESMFGERHDYLLPIEKVDEWWGDQSQSLRGAVLEAIDAERLGSSQYGPVRHPGRFMPPDEAGAREIATTRYGFLYERLAREEEK